MLQITLDSAAKQNDIQSANPNNWDFKLQVVNEGATTELRFCFDDCDDNDNDCDEDEPPRLILREPLY